jgi:hypothetical protein
VGHLAGAKCGSFGGSEMRVIWRERNAWSFEDSDRTAQELKQFFFISLFEWVNALGHFHFTSLYELINFCQFTL